MQSTAKTSGMWRAIPPVFFFLRYLRKLVKSRRSQPRDDLPSALVMAQDSNQGLSDSELLSMIFLLIIAGHETTVNLIGNGTLALLEHPDQLEKLRANPNLIKPAIEELLRFASPVETATERFALWDIELHGVTIAKGESVFAVIASANRDERQFPDPDVFDITREPEQARLVRPGDSLLPGRVTGPARRPGGDFDVARANDRSASGGRARGDCLAARHGLAGIEITAGEVHGPRSGVSPRAAGAAR